MTTLRVVGSCVQGLPTVITLAGSTVVPLASSVTIVQAGTGYFYAGDVTDSANIGDQTVINQLTSLSAVQIIPLLLGATASATGTGRVTAGATPAFVVTTDQSTNLSAASAPGITVH